MQIYFFSFQLKLRKRVLTIQRVVLCYIWKTYDIIELLKEIGIIPEGLVRRVWAQKDLKTLKKWHKLAAHSRRIGEFMESISNPDAGHEKE